MVIDLIVYFGLFIWVKVIGLSNDELTQKMFLFPIHDLAVLV